MDSLTLVSLILVSLFWVSLHWVSLVLVSFFLVFLVSLVFVVSLVVLVSLVSLAWVSFFQASLQKVCWPLLQPPQLNWEEVSCSGSNQKFHKALSKRSPIGQNCNKKKKKNETSILKADRKD